MARYPTFEDYEAKKNFQDGVKRCDELLAKNPKDVQLLTTKLQLFGAEKQAIKPVLDTLLTIEPPIRDMGELFNLNAAVVESQRDVWPRARTVGTQMSKLWDNAVKSSASTNMKLELLVQRYGSAVEANYMVDAQQALIQLKAMQPKNRVIYMAHAAVTQLTSTSEGDMQSRLALLLAKKAVTENFDEEQDLDCRVPGQIFAVQRARTDLESIRGTRFAESKQVHQINQATDGPRMNGIAQTSAEIKETPRIPSVEGLAAEIVSLKARFAQLIESAANLKAMLAFATSTIRLFHTAIQEIPKARSRAKADVCFLAISALVKAYELSNSLAHLLTSAHLAETLLRLDPHIHEARMILIYLYTRLNLGSLAVHYFDSLSIKEVQFDTVGHALFTGLPHIYPHRLPTGTKEQSNPMSRAKQAVQVYTRWEQRLYESEASVLSNGQTGMIFDVHELRDALRDSLTKRIIFLEIRRQARIVLGDCSWHTRDLGPRCVANWIETRDTRDFAATFDFGFGVERALHGRRGRLPAKREVLYGLAADVAWCLACGKEGDAPVEDTEGLVRELESAVPDPGKLSLDDQAGGQGVEDLAGEVAYRALKAVLLLKASVPTSSDVDTAISALEKAVTNLPLATLCAAHSAYTETLRDHYIYLDTLKVVDKVYECGIRTHSSAALLRLQKTVKDGLQTLKTHGEEQRKLVSASSIRAEMENAGGEEVFAAVKALGKEELGAFCEAVGVAARDGWSGSGRLGV